MTKNDAHGPFFVKPWKWVLKKSGAAWWTLKWSRGGFLVRTFNKRGWATAAPLFAPPRPFFADFEAISVWTLSNVLHGAHADPESILHINFDETSVSLYQGGAGGFIAHAAQVLMRSPKSLAQDVGRAQLRTNITYLAMICDVPAIQEVLPQCILVSQKIFSEELCAALKDAMPPTCFIMRKPKAWVTSSVMLEVIRELRVRLASVGWTAPCVLIGDMYKAHICPPVLRAYGRYGFHFVCVPAGLTWALQPCDTHLFSLFKHRMRVEAETLLLQTASGKPTPEVLLRGLGRAITSTVMRSSWGRAFKDLGLSGTQASVSKRLKSKLGFPEELPLVPCAMPSLSQLQCLFLKRSIVPIAELFSYFTCKTRAGPLAPPHPSVMSEKRPPVITTHRVMTRSTSASSAAAPASLPAEASPCKEEEMKRPENWRMAPFLPNAKKMRRPRSSAELEEPAPPLPLPLAPPPQTRKEESP